MRPLPRFLLLLLWRARPLPRRLLLPALLRRPDAVRRGDVLEFRSVVILLLYILPHRLLLPRRCDRAGLFIQLQLFDDGSLCAAAQFMHATRVFVRVGNTALHSLGDGDGDVVCNCDGYVDFVCDGHVHVNRLTVSNCVCNCFCDEHRICGFDGHCDCDDVELGYIDRHSNFFVDSFVDKFCFELCDFVLLAIIFSYVLVNCIVDRDYIANVDCVEYTFRDAVELSVDFYLTDSLCVSVHILVEQYAGVCVDDDDGVFKRLRFTEHCHDAVGNFIAHPSRVPLQRLLVFFIRVVDRKHDGAVDAVPDAVRAPDLYDIIVYERVKVAVKFSLRHALVEFDKVVDRVSVRVDGGDSDGSGVVYCGPFAQPIRESVVDAVALCDCVVLRLPDLHRVDEFVEIPPSVRVGVDERVRHTHDLPDCVRVGDGEQHVLPLPDCSRVVEPVYDAVLDAQ